MKQTRTRHSQTYKDEALALAERLGVSKAAEQLGLHPSQIYGWRSKRQKIQSCSEREQSLVEENARLKRQLADHAEELAIVKKAAEDSTDHCNTATEIFCRRTTPQYFAGSLIQSQCN